MITFLLPELVVTLTSSRYRNNGVGKSKVTKNEIKQAIQTRIGKGLNIYLSYKKLNLSTSLRKVIVCIKKI